MTIHNSFKNRIMAAMGVVILAGTLSMFGLDHSTAQITRDCPGVAICNTISDPVPVVHQGTARIEGSVNVTNVDAQPIPVKQQGDWQVGLSGPVAIDSSPRSPVNVVQAITAENIFYAQANVVIPQSGPPGVVVNPPGFDVPAGKMLLIKYVSADIQMGHAFQMPNVLLRTTHPTSSMQLTKPLLEVRQGSVEWAISEAASVPAKPGTPLEVHFSRSGAGGGPPPTMTIAIMGDLVDSP